MLKRFTLLLAPLISLLVACTASETPGIDPTTPTALESFGANPNPAPANIPVIFSWSVTGDDLTCAVDIDSNGTDEYTVQNCSSSSRASHVYGVQGSYTAQLTVTGADGVTQKKTTPVKLEVENQAPSVLSFDVRQGSKENSLIFAWVVSDSGADTLSCRLDADGDGQWESDRLCSATQQSGQVNGLATSSNQVEITLPTGSYNSIFEVYDAYSTTRKSSKSRSPYNRLPQITTFTTTAGDKLLGTVAFKVTDPDRDKMICSLTVQGIGQFVYQNCSTITRSYTFPKEGTYQVKLEVIDEYKGVASKTANLVFVNTSRLQEDIVGGSSHSCRLLATGAAYCWGSNDLGQLGNGTTDQSTTPVAVSMPAGVTFTQISSVAASYTCALGSDNKAYCWGNNLWGQLGNGTTTYSTTPVAVSLPGGVTFTYISAGADHVCALGSDNKAYCWGYNGDGQLGNGTTTNSTTPVAASLPGGVTINNIWAGEYYTCASGSDNNAYCWGVNDYGQLGNGSTAASTTPVAVTLPGGVTFTKISPASAHTCALGSDKKAYCWGGGDGGRLGNGNTTDSSTPVAVSMPGGVAFTRIQGGEYHTCALGTNKIAYCWGGNSDGQLGNGNTTDSSTPVAVSMPGGISFTSLGVGYNHTCATGSDKKAYCWGVNDYGQLGNGTTDNSETPVAVSLP